MDSLTHLLVGHAMGAVATSMVSPTGAAVYWAAVVGNSLPDIDVPLSLILRRDVRLHRTITHTLPGVFVLSIVAAVGIRLFFPEAAFLTVFGWALLGNLTHLTMDCLNLFGARPFWPLHSRSVDLAVLHIMDPILILMLGIPAGAAAIGRAHPMVVALSFFLVPCYVLYRWARARGLAQTLKRTEMLRAKVIPWFMGWRYVFETDRTIEFGCWRQGRRHAISTFPKSNSPLIQASLANPAVTSFLSGAEYPFAELHEDDTGHEVVWGDAVRKLRADYQPLRVRINN